MTRARTGAGTRRTLLLTSVAVLTLALAAIATARSALPASELGRDPVALLAAVKAVAPYQIALPTVPPDYHLDNIEWLAPSPVTGDTAFSVDIWWVSADGGRLHFWQTDNRSLGLKDPVLAGTPVTLDTGTWTELTDHPWLDGALSVLSKRLEDGTTVSLDGLVTPDQLRGIAETIRP